MSSSNLAIQGASERDPGPEKYSKITKNDPKGPPPKLPGKNSKNTKNSSKILIGFSFSQVILGFAF